MSDNEPQGTSPGNSAPAPATAEGEGRMVDCVKLNKSLLGLTKQPLKGDLGKRVYDSVSQQAWRAWLEHSKMLINEYRLDLKSENGQRIWMTELEKYFWGEGSALPPEFVAGEGGAKPADTK